MLKSMHFHVQWKTRPLRSDFWRSECLSFLASGQVRVEPLPLTLSQITRLYDHLLLFGQISKEMRVLLKEQRDNTADKMMVLKQMRDQVFEMQERLTQHFEIETFGRMLHQGCR